ncbi:hypothetical protein N0V93_010152 [Gnomoniopsis smithogilvyi]|uniref:Uncharacterized protein n=1 Tax=Gnomoniopsis smithogilvyi TaxID=1191159 RepID=A0A9W8YID1_9PEZI|nr:hypothetical protein N0V93_010152 [Gnomoniopsis smithogilvyi]
MGSKLVPSGNHPDFEAQSNRQHGFKHMGSKLLPSGNRPDFEAQSNRQHSHGLYYHEHLRRQHAAGTTATDIIDSTITDTDTILSTTTDWETITTTTTYLTTDFVPTTIVSSYPYTVTISACSAISPAAYALLAVEDYTSTQLLSDHESHLKDSHALYELLSREHSGFNFSNHSNHDRIYHILANEHSHLKSTYYNDRGPYNNPSKSKIDDVTKDITKTIISTYDTTEWRTSTTVSTYVTTSTETSSFTTTYSQTIIEVLPTTTTYVTTEYSTIFSTYSTVSTLTDSIYTTVTDLELSPTTVYSTVDHFSTIYSTLTDVESSIFTSNIYSTDTVYSTFTDIEPTTVTSDIYSTETDYITTWATSVSTYSYPHAQYSVYFDFIPDLDFHRGCNYDFYPGNLYHGHSDIGFSLDLNHQFSSHCGIFNDIMDHVYLTTSIPYTEYLTTSIPYTTTLK